MDLFQISVTIIALLVASLIQGAIGFGAALVLIPLLLLAGFDLPAAIVVALITSTFQNIIGWWKLRSEIKWKEIRGPVAIRVAGLLVGFLLLPQVNSLGPERLKQIFGGLLILMILVQTVFRIKPRDELHPAWGWAAFAGSGFTQGTLGAGGPPLVFWLMAQKRTHARNRVFLFALFLLGSIPHAMLMVGMYQQQVIRPTMVGLLGTPIILAGTALGLWIGNHMNEKVVRAVTYTTLFLMAVMLIINPFVGSNIAK